MVDLSIMNLKFQADKVRQDRCGSCLGSNWWRLFARSSPDNWKTAAMSTDDPPIGKALYGTICGPFHTERFNRERVACIVGLVIIIQ